MVVSTMLQSCGIDNPNYFMIFVSDELMICGTHDPKLTRVPLFTELFFLFDGNADKRSINADY